MNTNCIRVLVVDDNKDLRLIMGELFLQYADIVMVGTASNGQQALAMILAHKIDVVLLDIIMPGMDGMEVLAKLQEMEGEKPAVLVLSAVGGSEIIGRAMALGAAAFLVKPVDVQTLIDKIRSIYRLHKHRGLAKVDIG